jgi:hypothetical protein
MQHVFEVVMGFGYLFVVLWVLSNLADDEEEKAPRDFPKVEKES